MSLTRAAFIQQCKQYVDLCQRLGDNWYLARVSSDGGCLVPTDNIDVNNADELSQFVLVKREQKSINLSERGQTVYSYEYHVIYSESYEVPVMYFSISDHNGSVVPVDEFIKTIPSVKDLSTVITQIEHPLLFTPIYMVHPCRTRDFMAPHQRANSENNYLITWLSIVGNLLDLKLDNKLGHFTGMCD